LFSFPFEPQLPFTYLDTFVSAFSLHWVHITNSADCKSSALTHKKNDDHLCSLGRKTLLLLHLHFPRIDNF
jgi:hypothetical protein